MGVKTKGWYFQNTPDIVKVEWCDNCKELHVMKRQVDFFTSPIKRLN